MMREFYAAIHLVCDVGEDSCDSLDCAIVIFGHAVRADGWIEDQAIDMLFSKLSRERPNQRRGDDGPIAQPRRHDDRSVAATVHIKPPSNLDGVDLEMLADCSDAPINLLSGVLAVGLFQQFFSEVR
jgi:hypothetical protein